MPTHSGIEAHVHAMKATDADTTFGASIPTLYETYLVPLIFERYAADLANRLACRSVSRVLEIAAGTGALTRALAFALPENVAIVATDLNQPMLDQGSALGTTRPVQWLPANAMQLPFENGTFDAVVCQFGAMFFAEKATAFSEARRVLRPGGVFMFNTWDRIEENEFADAVTTALESLFPKDPPRFLARIPHGYHDRVTIQRDLADAGFLASPQITTVVACSRAKSSWIPAIAYCQGTPLRSEIEARDASRLDEATSIAADAIGRRFGQGSVEGKMQAHIVAVEN
jgi:SAM-dependent methyltransferase